MTVGEAREVRRGTFTLYLNTLQYFGVLFLFVWVFVVVVVFTMNMFYLFIL